MDWINRLLGRPARRAAATEPRPDAPPARATFAVVDVETTGLSPRDDRVLELAIVLLDSDGTPGTRWATLLDPEGPVGATHIHGITAAKVEGQPKFREVASHVVSMLRGTIVVGHNVRFDLSFIGSEFGRAGWDVPTSPSYCTLDGSHSFLTDMDRRRLTDCCWEAGISLREAHSALGDADATAQLFDWYLHRGAREFWDAELRTLLAVANSQTWPVAPARAADLSCITQTRHLAPHRFVRARPKQPALVRQLARLSLAELIDDGAPQDSITYLETLLSAIEDGVIDESESEALAQLALAHELDADDRRSAHVVFVSALAHLAVDDGHVSRDERAELNAVARLLGVDDAAQSCIARADAARSARMSAGLHPLPSDWTLGEPLRVGDKVVFTGCDELQRERLEKRAEELGVRVVGAVSRFTSMLVTDGGFHGTKAERAELLGTRIVDPDMFEDLLAHLQPAISVPVITRTGLAGMRAGAPTVPNESAPQSSHGPELGTASPAAIRAWALDRGMDVGVRGRVSAEIVAAYYAAA